MPSPTGGARSGGFLLLLSRMPSAKHSSVSGRARPSLPPHRVTALRVFRELAWFRVCGYGLWVKWGSAPDLHMTRKTARYLGRLRWKTLRPEGA